MDHALLTTLRRHNPWLDEPRRQPELLAGTLPNPFVPRRRKLELRPGLAELVVGPRQAGKSTWIREVLSRQDDPVLMLNAEEPAVRELGRSPALALEALAALLRPETILFFEEAQRFEDAPLFVKGLVDLEPRRRIVVTGSASFPLQARNRESLAGRARRTLLLPLSLQETSALVEPGLAPAITESHLSRQWHRHLVGGGYPAPWFDREPELLLNHLVETFVLKDVSDLHILDRPAVFRKLLELAAADMGNLANLSEWASVARAARNTVARYLEIAEAAFVLRLVPPFVGGKRAEITAMPKVFFLDNGLRNTLFGGLAALERRPDRGALWENAVFTELLKRLELLDDLRFWRTKSGAEVDFVIRRRERLIAVEVKATELRRPTITRSARSFISAYQPACFGVISAGPRGDTTIDGVPVHFCRPWELGLVLEALG